MLKRMKLHAGSLVFLAAISGAALPTSADDPAIKLMPLNIGAAQEWGLVKKGLYNVGHDAAQPVTNDWIDHFTAYVSKSAIVEDRLFITAGLGGVFQYRKPEIVDPGFSGSQHKAFFIGPSTEAMYHFGDPEKPWAQVGAGNFFYKYDDAAFDLGEYLFRSAAYPTYTITGGYSIINDRSPNIEGFVANFHVGDFRADIFMNTQTGFAPLYDWSPAAVLGYSIGDGLLDLGAGVNFSHLFEVKPSRSAAHTVINGYFTAADGKDYSANPDFYSERASYDLAHGHLAEYDADTAAFNTVNNAEALPDSVRPTIKYFDAKSILLMARATFDPKKLFATDLFGANDLKLYGEIGVLGVQNKPVFYQKISERMPMMIGFNIPTFKLLDLFSVQMEYLNSPYLNNTYQLANFAANTPYFPTAQDTIISKSSYNDMAKKDNVKWAVMLKKSFGKLSFTAQAADDHMRLTSANYYYGPQFDHNEVTVSKHDWYVMTQLAWGI